MMQKILERLAQTAYVREALENPPDMSELHKRPTTRMITGLILIGISYLIGWPAVAALSILAAWVDEPLIAIIGGPTTYGLSYIVFIVGAWLAGLQYARILAKYVTETVFRKLLRHGKLI
jgi:hypothetical protein